MSKEEFLTAYMNLDSESQEHIMNLLSGTETVEQFKEWMNNRTDKND